MNANELADFIKDISEYAEFNGRTYCQQCFKEAQDMLRQQQVEIEALKQIIDANNLSQNIGQFVKPDLKIEEVMSENCTCYKLSYSPLNNFTKVNNENNNKVA